MWQTIIGLLASVARIWDRRSANMNAPDVKEAKKRQDEGDAQGKETKAVSTQDTDASQRNWSE